MTRDQLAQVDGAVDADEARSAAAESCVVARGAVTTRVVGEAVRRRAGATDVRRRTRAAVAGHQIRTRAAVQTRSRRTLVYVGLTVGSCVSQQQT